MNPLQVIFSSIRLETLFSLFAQESEGSGFSWALILFLLLVLALSLVWWLLGPGAKRRRDTMRDLPRPASRPASRTTATPPAPVQPAAGMQAAAPRSVVPTPPPPPVPATSPATLPAPVAPSNAAVVDAASIESAATGIIATEQDEVRPAVVQAAEPDPAMEPDNLRKLDGIGPKVEGVLQENGIATYADLAAASVEQVAEILETEGLKFIKPDTWPEQASLAAQSDWDGLQALQDELKGGRRVEP